MEGRDGSLLGQVIVLAGSEAGVEVGEKSKHEGRGDLVACVSNSVLLRLTITSLGGLLLLFPHREVLTTTLGSSHVTG